MSESYASELEVIDAGREARLILAEQSEKIVELTWKKMMSVAQSHVSTGKLDESGRTVSDEDVRTGFYNRERQMILNLETLFSITHEKRGYLAFLGTLTRLLDADNPIAMAFLSHILDRSALPDRETLKETAYAILDKLNKKPGRMYRMVSLLSGHYRNAVRKDIVRKQITDQFIVNTYMGAVTNAIQVQLKLNAAILWSILADKFAGELSTYIWQRNIGNILVDSLANPQEEILVRLFSLLALEKFSVTASCKQQIEELSMNIRELLISIVQECDSAIERIHILSFEDNRPMGSLFTPPAGPLREEWAKYIQLKMCCQWALDRAFRVDTKITWPWNLTRLRVIMNPYDSTANMKFTNNGLQLRNDKNHFESARATACVKKGKWFYETQLLSHGIIQVGWATSRCHFSPEDGYGVGDDCNGFAFDTFRAAVWADGVCVHPNGNRRARCAIGDVVGTLLDLDNGKCSFYINGKDVGMTVEFEHHKDHHKKHHHKGHESRHSRTAARASATRTSASRTDNNRTDNNRTSNTTSTDTAPTTATATRSASHAYTTANSMNAASNHGGSNTITRSATNPPPRDTASRPINNTSSSTDTGVDNNTTPVNRSDFTTKQNIRPDSKWKKALGLYPAISLTTNQHVRVNFGDEPWMYRPPITCAYWGINQAGELDEYFKKRVMHWVEKRGRISHGKYFGPTNTQPLRPRYGADEIPEGQLYFSDSSSDDEVSDIVDSDKEDDSAENRCNICYSEPSNVTLYPCKHGDIGSQCAAIIKKCPLCRVIIEDRVVKK